MVKKYNYYKKKIDENKKYVRIRIEEKISDIEKEIKENKKMVPERKVNLKRKIFNNAFTSAIIMFIFVFILMGYDNIPFENYIVDLKVFSIIAIFITINIFEYAYKKDSGSIAILGIESLFISFAILSLYYILENNIYSYRNYLLFMSMLFIMYYIFKIIIISIKDINKYRKNINEIKNIVKKEEI